MPIDNQVQSLIAKLEAAKLPPFHTLSPSAARATSGALSKNAEPGPDLWSVQEFLIGDDRKLKARLYRPGAAADALMIYFHGGGWVLGDLNTCDAPARILAKTANVAVLSVEYRLAPEHPFPAAVDDAMAALRWSASHSAELLGGLVPLIVAGDSAGANLAAVAAIQARDAGGPDVMFQLLFYPVTDANFDTASYAEFSEAPILTRRLMQWFWDLYLPDPAARVDPRASPLRTTILSALPPALIQTAEYDPLRSEGEAYAARLQEAGVPTTLQRRAGLTHGFTSMCSTVAAAGAALEDAALALREAVRVYGSTRERGCLAADAVRKEIQR